MKKLRFLTLILAVFLLCSCGARVESHVIVAGSTSVQPYVEILAEEFKILFPEIAVNVQGSGSTGGIRAVQNGIADIGMSSRALAGEELNLWHIAIAKDALALIVHPDNPVSSLTLEQIRRIYSGDITNWSMVGGNNAVIHVVSRENGSGTRSAFQEMVMADMFISRRAIVQNTNGAIRQIVAGNKNAIGFISLGLVDYKDLPPVKALNLNDIEPTQDNVFNGIYPLFRSFLFLATEEPLPNTPAGIFLEFTLSDEGQSILSGEGLIPVRGGTA